MKNLKDRIKEIDDGRFADIIDHITALNEKDCPCENCNTFNPSAKEGYLCAVAPSCPGQTLSLGVQSYIGWKLGWITEKEHKKNCPIGYNVLKDIFFDRCKDEVFKEHSDAIRERYNELYKKYHCQIIE